MSRKDDKPRTVFGNVEYTVEERAFLQKALAEKIDSDALSQRPGPGGTSVNYLETWKAIELANNLLGFNGWSSSIVEITQDYLDQTPQGRFNAGVSAIVRVTLKDGTSHEDLGYGSADNQKHKGAALEIAKKKAISDALKRALRNLGNALGLTIYDKEYLTKLRRAKRKKTNNVEPPKPKEQNPFYSMEQPGAIPQWKLSNKNTDNNTQLMLPPQPEIKTEPPQPEIENKQETQQQQPNIVQQTNNNQQTNGTPIIPVTKNTTKTCSPPNNAPLIPVGKPQGKPQIKPVIPLGKPPASMAASLAYAPAIVKNIKSIPSLCLLQALMIQVSNWLVFLWVCCIAFWLTVATYYPKWWAKRSKTTSIYMELGTHLFVIIVTTIMSILPLFPKNNFGPAGLWCWIDSSTKMGSMWRFASYYAPLWVAILLVSFLYSLVLYRVYRTYRIRNQMEFRRLTHADKSIVKWNMYSKVTLFPFVFVIVWIIPTLNRIYQAITNNVVEWLQITHMTVKSLYGFFNVLIFLVTNPSFIKIICCYTKSQEEEGELLIKDYEKKYDTDPSYSTNAY